MNKKIKQEKRKSIDNKYIKTEIQNPEFLQLFAQFYFI